MQLILTDEAGKKMTWEFRSHDAIDKIVEALKANVENWIKIEIIILRK